MSALGHVWTAPWQELSDAVAALVGCGHVSKFGPSDGRTVTAEIFLGAPGSLVLLGAGGLVPAAGALAYTTSFPSIHLVPGAALRFPI
jgi:hypothetical protein